MHGGVAKDDLGKENVTALKAGITNLARHIENVRSFGVQPVVAINGFSADTEAEIDAIKQAGAELGVDVIGWHPWTAGGSGRARLDRMVVVVTAPKSNLM